MCCLAIKTMQAQTQGGGGSRGQGGVGFENSNPYGRSGACAKAGTSPEKTKNNTLVHPKGRFGAAAYSHCMQCMAARCHHNSVQTARFGGARLTRCSNGDGQHEHSFSARLLRPRLVGKSECNTHSEMFLKTRKLMRNFFHTKEKSRKIRTRNDRSKREKRDRWTAGPLFRFGAYFNPSQEQGAPA